MSWFNDAMGWTAMGDAYDSVTGHMFPDAAAGAMGYLDQNPDIYHQYYDPYVQWGQETMPGLQEQYSMLMNDPAAQWAMMGQGFQQSPGYQFQVDQAMQGSNNAMAAGGMLGTPAHQQQNMNYANQIANQDYYNYMGNVGGLFNQGLQGTQGMFDTGYNASMGLAGNLAGNNASKANLQYAGQANKNNALGGLIGGIAGMAGGMM